MAIYNVAEGQYETGDARFGIIAARFNHHVVERLLEAAVATFERHRVSPERLDIVRVPGAFELPLAAQWLGQRDDIAAVVTLGCVIRGDTPHFDYVCSESARGLGTVALALSKPVIFGVLTTNNQVQADERAGGAHGNKGAEAALAALEMVSLMRSGQ